MDIDLLSKQINIDKHELLIRITNLDKKHNLGIEDLSKLSRTQYDTLRSLLDPYYLVKLLSDNTSDRKYNYQKTIGFDALQQWIEDQNNLEGVSTKDIQNALPGYIGSRGHQVVAAAMRAVGYKSSVDILDNGKQGRRWHKAVSTPSFF